MRPTRVRWLGLCLALSSWGPAGAALAQAAGVPASLSTRDPTAGPGQRRSALGAAPVITAPPRSAASRSAPSVLAENAHAAGDEAHLPLRVSGIKGTLNSADVHQRFEARQSRFDACVQQSRRNLGWLRGAIRFAFKVDASGRISQLRPLTSSIGHRGLETCLTQAVAGMQFPKPAGHAGASFSWGMSVEPVVARSFEAARLKPSAKQLRELFRSCDLRRGRVRFRVTAYVGANGHVLAAGAVPSPAAADDKVDCVIAQFSKWQLPKREHASKMSFELR